jgi:hypothetical protein
MASDAILRSYGDSGAREDVVMNAIEILTARETQIYNMLGKTTAINTIHSYLVDTLRTAASQAVEEAADYTALANTTPTRLTNIVEIISVPFKVSRTQQDLVHYSGQNELQRQTEKALMDWANAAEFDLVRATLTSGVSGTAPKMQGIIAGISKANTYTSQTSGTVWASSILDGLVQNNWDNSNGDVPTEIFMGSILRKNTDYFTQKTNVVVNAQLPDLIKTVSTYTTAFTTMRVHTHRYVQQSSDATGRVLALNPDKLKVAVLRAPYIDTTLARSGDYDVRAVVGKFTLEVRNQDDNFYADGFLKA